MDSTPTEQSPHLLQPGEDYAGIAGRWMMYGTDYAFIGLTLNLGSGNMIHFNTHDNPCLRRGILLFVFFVSVLLLSSQVQASTNNANPSVEFSDIGTLTLSAEAVPLGTLLEKIQEKSSMEFEIPEKLLNQAISVSFKSLPLDKAIRRILRGVSYSCIFDSKGNMKKIIALPNASKDKDNHIGRRASRLDLPHKRAMETTPPPEVVKDLVEAIEDAGGTPPPELVDEDEMEEASYIPPPHPKDIINSMIAHGITLPPGAMKDVEEAVREAIEAYTSAQN